MDFSKRLDEALKLRDYSQSQLARELNISPQAVQKWLSGNGNPRMARIQDIAEKLNVSEEWLVSGHGSPFREPQEREQIEQELQGIMENMSDTRLSDLLKAAKSIESGS